MQPWMGSLRPDDRCGKEVCPLEHPGPGRLEQGSHWVNVPIARDSAEALSRKRACASTQSCPGSRFPPIAMISEQRLRYTERKYGLCVIDSAADFAFERPS